MVSASIRVLVIVLFFTPSFGLFSILGHWKLEQIPYSKTVNNRFQTNNMVYLYNTEPFPWTDLNRYNYTSDSGPDYTVYTYFSLTEYFFGFWILLFLHTYTNLLAKIALSEDFRKKWTSSKLAKFIHCLENINIPTVWKDWEEKDGSIEDHKRRHGQVVTEMVVIMVIRTIFNAVMLAPIVYTATNVWERHNLLSSTIGVMNIEQESYDNVNILFYIVVFLFPLLSILEICLYCIYQFKFHPWVEIIKNPEDTGDLKTTELNLEETKNTPETFSRKSSKFNKGINDILQLASNVLAEANINIQDKIDTMEKLKGHGECKEVFQMNKLSND